MKKLVVKSLPGRPEHRLPRNRRFRGRHLFILLVAALIVFVAYKKYYRQLFGTPEKTAVISAVAPGAEIPPLHPHPGAQKPEASEKFEIRHQLVRSGDSMAKILDRFEISRDHIGEWERACKPAPFARIQEGDELIFFLGLPDRRLLKVFYSAMNGPAYALRETPDGWECHSQEAAPRVPAKTVRCQYADNFYDSCISGGLPPSLIANLADVFSHDIDFNVDLKDGDSFTVFFQEQEIEGKDGKQYLVLAAEMIVSGKVFQAFGFQLPDEGWEYFDAKGASLKRAFLKSPLGCRRMLSPGTHKTVKPVLKINRPRFAIDYATTKGAPVSAVGDGVVTALNKKGKSAILIEIRHRGGFRSIYGNLSGFSRSLYRGGIVLQGEAIGSVGSAPTGKPCLSFQFLKNGKPVNFQSADFHRAYSIPKTMRAEFEKTRDSYVTALQGQDGADAGDAVRRRIAMADLFAEIVILGTALDKSLHYAVPGALAEALGPGSLVSVELGRRKAAGIVLSLSESPPDLPDTVKIRPILDYSRKTLPDDLLQLCLWISNYYFYPLGEVLALAVPGRESGSRRAPAEAAGTMLVRLADPVPEGIRISEKDREILDLLKESSSGMPLKELRRTAGNYRAGKLLRAGMVRIEECEDPPDCPESQATPAVAPFEPTIEQSEALDIMGPCIDNPSFQPFVLYGVTGSGKTEIYLRLVERAALAGRGSLVLVPEIALSTQMEAIFRERFGGSLAVWHSAVSRKERRRQGAEIFSGKASIVLGARSAVLTAVKNPGLIIVDEEHDPAYKQEDRLRYNARDVALMRAKILGIPIVLGSATPSLQTIHRCGTEQYRPVTLPSRIFGRPLPDLEIVDMKRERGRGAIFSARLGEGIEQALNDGRQALIFLNRRGYATYYLCNACGFVLQCVSCSVTLTYHKKENRLRCHYCGWETPLPERCPSCSHAALFAHGFGTERVEKEIGRLFPGARTVRVDRDTMSSPEKILDALDAVRSGRANVLLGTQMIAKGHDFPNITLVGVINADAGLQVSDFRAGENLVQLLFQVSGRAGRGEEPGRVILQTYNPYHYTIESLLKMDYDGFCEKELESRRTLQYPPFTRLLKFLVTARDENVVRNGARSMAALCREKAAVLKESGKHIAVMGPSPAAYVKLKDRFRWQVFIKAWQSSAMQDFARMVLTSVKSDPALRDVQVTVDRDPANEI